MEPTSAAEQRAFAVAKLKRAASLPRMKDGRRPPMHVEAVSEGEKTHGENKVDDDSAPSSAEDKDEKSEEKTEVTTEPTEAELSSSVPPTPITPTTPIATRGPSKRRSRSRSRSRGSKDLKGRGKLVQSPIQNCSTTAEESSPDDHHPSLPPIGMPLPSSVFAPIPSRFAVNPNSRPLMSPPPMFYPGTSPPTPLPSLDAIQKGLFRSNSAVARMMSYTRLTGGTEPHENPFSSPSPTPPPGNGRLTRNHTVGGGERVNARRNLLQQLNKRIKEADGDHTSGGEEIVPPAPPKRKRRPRSRRSSAGQPAVVDDRDLPSTSPTTPAFPPIYTPDPPELRPPSRTPSQTASARQHSLERNRDSALAKLTGEDPFQYEMSLSHRGVVVEDEDDVPDNMPSPLQSSQIYNYGLPSTPTHRQISNLRVPHASDAPSSTSVDSSGVGVPVFFSDSDQRSQQDLFPTTPFGTPLRERTRDDDEEQVLYQHAQISRTLSPWNDGYDREISWVADPVPVSRMPIHDDDEDEDDEDEDDDEVVPSDDGPHEIYGSPRLSYDSKELVVELETSLEVNPLYGPPSPSSAVAFSNTTTRESNASSTSAVSPPTLTVAIPGQVIRSHSNAESTDWDEARVVTTEITTSKRTADGGSTTVWEKLKSSVSRSGSSTGRRSRTNSIGARDKRDPTDSSTSRESGASSTGNGLSWQGAQSPIGSPSASVTFLSSTPQPLPPGSVSPIPPPTSADFAKYAHSKLNPFPGLMQLERQRSRARGNSLSVSSPDIVLSPNGSASEARTSSSGTSTAGRTPEMGRDRKLVHQASDTRLLAKYQLPISPQLSSSPSAASQMGYFDIQPPLSPPASANSLNLKLPMNRKGVKEWLRIFSSQAATSSPSTPTSPPSNGDKGAGKKPSLSDLLMGRKESDIITEWEEIDDDKSRSLISPRSTPVQRRVVVNDEIVGPVASAPAEASPIYDELLQLRLGHQNSHANGNGHRNFQAEDLTHGMPSPGDPEESVSPDPVSSVDEYPSRSTSQSSSALSSSLPSPPNRSVRTDILERLEEKLGPGQRSPMWTLAFDDPPRKLLLSSPVLQVANANTVKDRFLFLFTDVLVVAKPVMQDHESLVDGSKHFPVDRKFIVKSVVQLNQLRFCDDRHDNQMKLSSYTTPQRHPYIRTFVHQFAKDPDHAISVLLEKSGIRDDPTALGRLMFKTVDLDRARLGHYLSQRTSKLVLKAYIDSFGFTSMRIDKALRVFLNSLHIPASRLSSDNALEYLIDAFASRWYEANAHLVTYDKDLAMRLIRAIVQLNEVLYSGITQESGIQSYPKRHVNERDFIEAFRRYDPRNLVPDDLLDKIYTSIRHERLCQARNSATGRPDIPVAVKRALPQRLTYKIQSDPIILRIPQPDPHLTIQLHGQDLMFDPPVLTFAKAAEASFRVTGTSLGAKSMILSRSGPNAPSYTGLPLSSPVVVERAFMRNTFQIAFQNHLGKKRKYMFSVDDPLIRHQWIVSLKRQIEAATRITSSHFHRAAEKMAFRILAETLVGTEEATPPGSAIDKALAQFVLSPRHRSSPRNPSVSCAPETTDSATTKSPGTNGAHHTRSKSRSQLYYKDGAGKIESEAEIGGTLLQTNEGVEDTPRSHAEGQIWAGRELEMLCQQNSSIALVLSYLQVGSPDHQDSGLQSPGWLGNRI